MGDTRRGQGVGVVSGQENEIKPDRGMAFNELKRVDSHIRPRPHHPETIPDGGTASAEEAAPHLTPHEEEHDLTPTELFKAIDTAIEGGGDGCLARDEITDRLAETYQWTEQDIQ